MSFLPDSWDPLIGVIILINAFILVIVTIGRNDETRFRWPVAVGCVLAVLCYLYWRFYYIRVGLLTGDMGSVDGVLTIAIFLFEVINFADFFIFLWAMSSIKDRKTEVQQASKVFDNLPTDDYPWVDVFVATYNEEWGILNKTLMAIAALDYPKVRTYILDDGKRDWLQAKCKELGINYISRPGNLHKKPGNHNYALAHTDSPFIAVFDADFIPLPDFLRKTVAMLLQNPTWGIVQTPQVFYNPDPMRNSLGMQDSLPDDTAMFFTVMEPCRDAKGVAFYVGSSAVLRRAAVTAIDGIVMGYDTEDQITSIAMLQKGFVTGFINERLSVGLAPETLSALFEQRKRWARGSIQILFSKHGPFGPNLTMSQRLLFSQSFWLVGFIAPIVYALIPAAMWLFQLRLFPYMPPEEVVVLPVFMFLCINITIWWLSRGLWVPLLSQALQLLISLEVLPTILTTLVKPFGKPLLNFVHVTPKGSAAGNKTHWRGVVILSTIVAFTFIGMARYLLDDFQFINHPDELIAAFLWTCINLLIILFAILSCFSPIYKRGEERFPLELTGFVGATPITTKDISMSGVQIDNAVPDFGVLAIDGIGEIAYRVIRKGKSYGLRFTAIAPEVEKRLFSRIFLDAANHSDFFPTPTSLVHGAVRRLLK